MISLRRAPFGCAVLLSLVVFFAPGSSVPGGIELNDKVVHAALFFVLAVTGVVAGLPLRALAFGLMLYAGLSEVLQAVLPIDRDGSVFDALADLIGAAAGLATALVVRRQKA